MSSHRLYCCRSTTILSVSFHRFSFPLTSPPTMSFSSLPTELVRQVIGSSVPSTFHSTTYRERQLTLRSLCLVSRQFRSIAQPLLFEIIWITSQNRTDSVLSLARKERRSFCTRQLVLGRGFGVRVLEASFQQLIESESSLGKLVLATRGLHAFPSMPLARTPLPPFSYKRDLRLCCNRSFRPSRLDRLSFLD